MRTTFQEDLQRLEAHLQEEGQLVLRALRGAMGALRERDVELADDVIAFDDEVDLLCMRIETGVQTLLARQTPVASDLRLVLAVLKINLHLERMADYCVTIAKYVKLTRDLQPERKMVTGLDEMGERAEQMTRVALDSFSARDIAAAESLGELDELIDRANRRAHDDVMELANDPNLREWGLRMLFVSRCLERIGDHAVDIGEQTVYLISGEFREFTDASH
jgi:phosphate transport system protein